MWCLHFIFNFVIWHTSVLDIIPNHCIMVKVHKSPRVYKNAHLKNLAWSWANIKTDLDSTGSEFGWTSRSDILCTVLAKSFVHLNRIFFLDPLKEWGKLWKWLTLYYQVLLAWWDIRIMILNVQNFWPAL